MIYRFLRKFFITVIDRNKRGVSTKDAVVRSPYHVPTQLKRNSSCDLLKHMIMRVLFTSLFFVIYHSTDLFFFLATVLSGS